MGIVDANKERSGDYVSAAGIFNNSGNYFAEAIMLEKAIFLEDNRTDLLYNQAQSYAYAKKYQEAIDSLKKAADIDNSASAYTLMGYYADTGLHNKTLYHEYLKKAITADIHNPNDAYMQASARNAEGDIAGAIQTLQDASARYPASGYIWFRKGLFEWVTGDNDSSLISLDHAIDRAQTDEEKYQSLWRKALVLTTSDKGTLEDLYYIKNSSENTIPGSSQSFQLFIANRDSRYGDYQNASFIFDRIEPETSGDPDYLSLFKGDLAYKNGDLKTAEKMYGNLTRRYNNFSKQDLFNYEDPVYLRDRANYGLFKIAMDKRDGKHAQAYAEELVRRNPDTPVYTDALNAAINLSIEQYFGE